MIDLIRVSSNSVKVQAGDLVAFGEALGTNIRTLEQVLSPTNGLVTDILHGGSCQSVILVVDSRAPVATRKCPRENKRILVAMG